MSDIRDDIIQVAVEARERGLSRIDTILIIADVYAAPWSGEAAIQDAGEAGFVHVVNEVL